MNVPAAVSKSFKIGDEIFDYREEPIKKWVGPFPVINVDGKLIHLDYNGDIKLYSKDKLKKYNFEGKSLTSPPEDSLRNVTGGNENVELGLLQEIDNIMYEKSPTDLEQNGSFADKFLRRLQTDENILITEVVEPSDPLSQSRQFEMAKRS